MTTPEELDALQERLRFFSVCWGDEPSIAPHSKRHPGITTGSVISAANAADAAITALRARVAELEAERDGFKRNLRESFEAMCAMRDSINEYLPMPSLESDLLQGPETSVFCATVTEAIVSELARRGQVVPLTANVLADAFEAMWNAAIGVAIERQEGHAVASMLAEGFAAMGRHLRDSAALVSPGDGWTPPPADQRPEGYRCLAVVEVEWMEVFKGMYDWHRPYDQRMYRIEEGAPGTYGFLPLPASEGADHG